MNKINNIIIFYFHIPESKQGKTTTPEDPEVTAPPETKPETPPTPNPTPPEGK